MEPSDDGYKPGPDLEEDSRNPLIDISLKDSTELWLIQWPLNQLQPDDFDGKEISLSLHEDGELTTVETSSGKCYDVVSSAAQEPDATVFLCSSSKSKIVGKISRRVCLVRYPDPKEPENGRAGFSNLSSQRSGVSGMKMWSTHQSRGSSKGGGDVAYGTSHDTVTSMDSMGAGSEGRSQKSKHKKRKQR